MSQKSDDTKIYGCAVAEERAPANPESVARLHLLRMSSWVVCVVFAGLTGSSCAGDATGPEESFEYHWQEDRGVAVTPAGEQAGGPLAWSPDGEEIFFRGPDGIKAVAISTSAVRVVDDRHSTYWGLTLSPAGGRVYFAATDSAGSIGLYSVTAEGGQSDLLVAGIDLVGVVPALAVSPDGVHIAYSAHGDSLFLHNLTDHSTVFVGTGVPLTFSSDGTGLLFGCPDWPSWRGGSPCAAFSYDLVVRQGGHVLDAESLDVDSDIEMVRWDREGIQVLLASSGQFTVWNVTSGVTEDLTVSLWQDEFLRGAGAWSSGGTMIAAWTTRCEAGDYWLPCGKGESRLHVIDADGRGDQVVAVVHSGLGVGPIIFSPDASRVAYSTIQRIYVKDLP